MYSCMLIIHCKQWHHQKRASSFQTLEYSYLKVSFWAAGVNQKWRILPWLLNSSVFAFIESYWLKIFGVQQLDFRLLSLVYIRLFLWCIFVLFVFSYMLSTICLDEDRCVILRLKVDFCWNRGDMPSLRPLD